MCQASVEMRLRFVSPQCAAGARQWGEAVLPRDDLCELPGMLHEILSSWGGDEAVVADGPAP